MTLASAVASADAARVVEGGKRLGSVNASFAFLNPSSPLITQGAQDYIEDCMRRGPTVQDEANFEEFLAIASACHVFAGWRYLGKAMYSLVDAARGISLHMAYYAELKAAKAILASAGIGMMNTCHFAMDPSGKAQVFGTLQQNKKARLGSVSIERRWPTHTAVWEAIKAWCQRPDVSNNLLSQFKVLGRTGDFWVRSAGGAPSQSVSWAANWSIDLKSLRGDSWLRNKASYQVDLDPGAYAAVRKDELKFVSMLSAASLSDSPGGLSGIDLALARDLVCKAGDSAGVLQPRLWATVSRFLQRHEGRSTVIARAETRRIRDAASMSGGALVDLADASNTSATGVMSRAFLLLRLATLAIRSQWEEIRRLSSQGVAPWQDTFLRQIAENCHLHSIGNPGTPNYQDMISDQEAAVDELEAWCEANTFDGVTIWHHTQGAVPVLRELCLLERIGLWAMA